MVYEKIYRSIVINMPYYFLYFCCFAAALGVVFYIDRKNEETEDILTGQGILAVLIALSIFIGYLLLVCLLGWSLIKIPTLWWTESNNETTLKKLLFKIALFEEQIVEQQNKVNTLVKIAKKVSVKEDIELYKEAMLSEINRFSEDMQKYDFSIRENSFLDSDVKLSEQYLGNKKIDYKSLTTLNLKVKDQNTKLRRLFSFKQETMKRAIFIEDIISNQKSGSIKLGVGQSNMAFKGVYLSYYRFWYLKNNRAIWMKIASVICAILSVFIISIEVYFFIW